MSRRPRGVNAWPGDVKAAAGDALTRPSSRRTGEKRRARLLDHRARRCRTICTLLLPGHRDSIIPLACQYPIFEKVKLLPRHAMRCATLVAAILTANTESVGQRIKRPQERAGLTQGQFATHAKVGARGYRGSSCVTASDRSTICWFSWSWFLLSRKTRFRQLPATVSSRCWRRPSQPRPS